MKFFTITTLLSLFLCSALAQSSPLDKKITISLVEVTLPEALNKISKAGDFSFSYNSSLISDEQIVTLYAIDRTVGSILTDLFKGTVSFKAKGRYIILKKVALTPKPSQFVIAGFVEDEGTGEKLKDASVYDKALINSVLTDEWGYFQMKFNKQTDSIHVAVSKGGYEDTVMVLPPQSRTSLKVKLHTRRAKKTVAIDTAKQENPLQLPYESNPNVQNISDTIYRDIQISFLPYIGTNKGLSGNTINDYSINFLGGYSLGTREIELGFFFNIDRGDVGWLQVAGVANLVGRNVDGIQASGFANINGGKMTGLQLSSFNGNRGQTNGLQIGALANASIRSLNGMQIAGFANYANKRSRGMQIAGGANVMTGQLRGMQLAGGVNVVTGNISGSQLAGVSNIATRKVKGSQISAAFNYGKNVQGTQIGILNFADSLGGVPIGLISYVNHGYHRIELSADELFYANLAFRTGARKFYNILLAGIQPNEISTNKYNWTFGYGLGTARKISSGIHLNIDLTAQHVSARDYTSSMSLLNKLHVGLDFKLARKFWIYGGVTFNGYISEITASDKPDLFKNYQPKFIHNQNWDTTYNIASWWGAKVALRFL
jgi:hypothetical protein